MTTAMTPSGEGTFWNRLTEQERAALAGVGRHRSYCKGATVIRAADPARWSAVLLSGRVRLTDSDGTHVFAVLQTGDIVGEQRVIDGQPQQATVRAETTVKALLVDGTDLDRLIGQMPRVLWVLCEVMSGRLRECYTRLVIQSADSFVKIVRFLINATKQPGNGPAPIHIGSQEALGEELSVSRDSVVRAMRRLRMANVVTTYRGMVIVRDPARLRAYLEP